MIHVPEPQRSEPETKLLSKSSIMMCFNTLRRAHWTETRYALLCDMIVSLEVTKELVQ